MVRVRVSGSCRDISIIIIIISSRIISSSISSLFSGVIWVGCQGRLNIRVGWYESSQEKIAKNFIWGFVLFYERITPVDADVI